MTPEPPTGVERELLPSQRAREAAVDLWRQAYLPRVLPAPESIFIQAFARFEHDTLALAPAHDLGDASRADMVLVPREPTEAMCLAWGDAGPLPMSEWEGMSDDEVNAACARLDWSAMLAAAPASEAPPSGAGDRAVDGPFCVYSEPDVGLPPSLFEGRVGETGFGPVNLDDSRMLQRIADALNAALTARPAELDAGTVEACCAAVRDALYPRNPQSDWTEFASIRAGCCISAESAIRTLASKAPASGGEPAGGK